MATQQLNNELDQAIPFRIEYRFDQAFKAFNQAHPQLDVATVNQWRCAFELAMHAQLDAATREFELLAGQCNETSFTALFNLSMCHLLNGSVADASIFFAKAESIRIDDYWLHIYSGITDFTLGLIGRANAHWWAATRIKNDDFGQQLLHRFFTDDHHPERVALYPLCQGRGIDVGCGHRKTHPEAVGIDLVGNGEKLETADNVRHRNSQTDIACSGDDLYMFADNSLDYVVQRHNLEHYQDPIKALQEWARVLKPGGILGMVVPDEDQCDTIRLDPTRKHVYTQASLRRLIHLLPGLQVVHMAPLLYKSSFICVVQKEDQQRMAGFNYPACKANFEKEEIRRRIDLYTQGGMPGLVAQCLRYLDLSYKHQRDRAGKAPLSGQARPKIGSLVLGLDRGNVHGWGICSQYLIKELSKLVSVEDLDQSTASNQRRHVEGKVVHALTSADFFPLFGQVRGDQNYGYTFFEKKLSDLSVKNAKKFDLVMAGSTWCRDRMLEKGIENCAILIQGIDPERFYPISTPSVDDRFVIFSGGKWELRKGQDLVLRAVKILQEKYPDVWLINCWYNMWPASVRMMESSPHIAFSYRKDASWEQNMLNTYALNGLDANRIITCDLIPHEQLRQLYARTHIGVFPNRCEGGTNLVLMEYMACGKPVIATNGSGHKDILNQDNALCLNDLREIRIVDEGGGDVGIWQEPSLDDLVDRIEYAYAHRDVIARIGARAGEHLKRFTWAHTARRLLTLLEG